MMMTFNYSTHRHISSVVRRKGIDRHPSSGNLYAMFFFVQCSRKLYNNLKEIGCLRAHSFLSISTNKITGCGTRALTASVHNGMLAQSIQNGSPSRYSPCEREMYFFQCLQTRVRISFVRENFDFPWNQGIVDVFHGKIHIPSFENVHICGTYCKPHENLVDCSHGICSVFHKSDHFAYSGHVFFR